MDRPRAMAILYVITSQAGKKRASNLWMFAYRLVFVLFLAQYYDLKTQ